MKGSAARLFFYFRPILSAQMVGNTRALLTTLAASVIIFLKNSSAKRIREDKALFFSPSVSFSPFTDISVVTTTSSDSGSLAPQDYTSNLKAFAAELMQSIQSVSAKNQKDTLNKGNFLCASYYSTALA